MLKSRAKTLGERIKKLRKGREQTQAELGAIVGVSTVYIGFVENGHRRPSLKLLDRLARALKVSPKDLV